MHYFKSSKSYNGSGNEIQTLIENLFYFKKLSHKMLFHAT